MCANKARFDKTATNIHIADRTPVMEVLRPLWANHKQGGGSPHVPVGKWLKEGRFI